MREPALEGDQRLRDGTRVRVRAIRPEDAATVQDGFRQLSPQSRSRRFRGPKARLSPRELRHLTHADGVRHVALGAVRLDADGWECEGLGIARYDCLPDHPEVAEPSLTVVDAAQGQGLGRLLAEELIRVAQANGVKTFRALLVDENEWLRERIRRSYPDARTTRRGQLLGVEIPLPALAPRPAGAEPDGGPVHFWSLLRWVAQGSVRPGRAGALRAWAHRRFWRAERPAGPPPPRA